MRVLFLAVVLVFSVVAVAEPITPGEISVLDGDTIRVHRERPDVRLVGFNAPETRRAQCYAEEQLGARAARRLRERVLSGDLDFRYVACSCPPGTAGTPACNHGRACGTLRANGRDVGDILIEEHLAVAFRCSAMRCPTTPRPWCG
jgi:endonuclease YncB( thermonuclease family)